MKYRTIVISFLLFWSLSGNTQTNKQSPIDTKLAKKISVSGFCLCQITLTDLKKLTNDLKEVEVEELDFPKNCSASDGRYINGKGYSSAHYPGLIFQKEENSDYISKIRLTKDFKGLLPNGVYVDLKELKLKDLANLYPELKDKWGSKDCSEYWSFSNDTIAFYVKINSLLQPQFPINEKFYLDKPIEAIELVVYCGGIYNTNDKIIIENPNEPVYFLDGIRVNIGVLKNYEPDEIAQIKVLKDSNAIKAIGQDGKNGVIYITTKEFAKTTYWNYLKSKSIDYQKAVPSIKQESDVVYIINNKVYLKNYEANLFDLNDSNLIELKVIEGKQLISDFNITDKKWGILIKSK